MKRGLVAGMACIMLSAISCTKERISGNGSTITENRVVNNFTAVSASGSSNVHITQGAFKVEVRGYNNLLPYYETKLVNNTLELGYKKNVNVKNDNIQVYITLPVLNGISLSGSGNIEADGNFGGNTNFDANITGSGNIDISAGSAQTFRSTIVGSGNIKALDFVADKAETSIDGSGNTEITATSQLKVKISGSGNVYYKGNPIITTNISGSGAVIPR